LSVFGGEKMLALLPDAKYEYPEQENYYFHGDHRIWYAPEQPDSTYIEAISLWRSKKSIMVSN